MPIQPPSQTYLHDVENSTILYIRVCFPQIGAIAPCSGRFILRGRSSGLENLDERSPNASPTQHQESLE
ncbi:MAG TPA: hypothetical protein V6D20_21645 [Candidatus Obscuribacterales bacterium]